MSDGLYREGKDYDQIDTDALRKKMREEHPLIPFDFDEQSDGEHWITIASPEFTAICPFSEYPDFGEVTISYVPDAKCLELKSFKMYINAFRDVKIFHETVTEFIFRDFLDAIEPKKAKIRVDMNVRGNVKTVCEKTFQCNT